MTIRLASGMMKRLEGHSTTASMRVSKTLDRGSIPRAPAIEIRSALCWSYFYFARSAVERITINEQSESDRGAIKRRDERKTSLLVFPSEEGLYLDIPRAPAKKKVEPRVQLFSCTSCKISESISSSAFSSVMVTSPAVLS